MRLRGDFNGVFGDLLCLSHDEIARDENDGEVILTEGMIATAFEPDIDDNGKPDEILADGTVIRSPEWLQCLGSKWALQMNDRGIYYASDKKD